jgi:hypothetical protein
MKTLVLGLCFVGFIGLSGSASAQCGCSGTVYVPYSPPVYAPVVVQKARPSTTVAPRTVTSSSSISYVNRLSEPLVRPDYTLLYAVHLNDGRVLLTEVVPRGYTVSGTEFRSSGRKVNASDMGSGRVKVTDPVTNQMIATFDR